MRGIAEAKQWARESGVTDISRRSELDRRERTERERERERETE